ncbi:50S ribosomal protein L25/general stress protein Ctc [Caldalkalibacillus salinus]|uniref:50S ribosomal protein L25/general stress protein Ctc n=1 Tax=Caldalkalibacillus salinus TaxID=2803787 RepID=UPI0019226319|nr:50S ribosomal protein L25/general stress protein Ctc [Caldalkalibacillus salinus]
MQKLAAQPRQTERKSVAKNLRQEGRIPAVVYGEKVGNASLSVEEGEFSKLLREYGHNVLVKLDWDGQQATAIIGEVQSDPLKGTTLHVDFQEVNLDKTLTADIPLEWVGEDGANKKGVLQKQTHALQVECLPKDLPDYITVDVSALDIGDSLSVGDLNFGQGIKPTNEEDTVIVRLAAPSTETEPEEPQQEVNEPELVENDDGED